MTLLLENGVLISPPEGDVALELKDTSCSGGFYLIPCQYVFSSSLVFLSYIKQATVVNGLIKKIIIITILIKVHPQNTIVTFIVGPPFVAFILT